MQWCRPLLLESYRIWPWLSLTPIPHSLCSSYMALLIFLKPETSLIQIAAPPPADNHMVHSFNFHLALLKYHVLRKALPV